MIRILTENTQIIISAFQVYYYTDYIYNIDIIYLILTTEQWLGINKKSEAMPDLVLNFAWPLVSWDVVRLKSSEALRKIAIAVFTCWKLLHCTMSRSLSKRPHLGCTWWVKVVYFVLTTSVPHLGVSVRGASSGRHTGDHLESEWRPLRCCWGPAILCHEDTVLGK